MGTEEILSSILEELKQVRYLLQERKPTPSGGAYPPNPDAEMSAGADGVWKVAAVPEAVKFKMCRDGCGKEIGWVRTPAGNRPIEKSGIQHKCPNYVPKTQRAPEPEPETAPQESQTELDVPF